jgi:type II secretory pathway pseudopilin PulG
VKLLRAPRFLREQGFTYLGLLLFVFMMGIGLALTGEVWQTAALRQREAELLQIGAEYRRAIERYYLAGPKQYPRRIEDLLRDHRHAGMVRHLRKAYPDPITGEAHWGFVRAPDGGIAGVHSLSAERPLKRGGFAVRERDFEGKDKYADWRFVYVPPVGAN